jgi:hypothetical protein
VLPAITEVYSFPVNTSVENLAVRYSGEVLATIDSAPEIYQLEPFGYKKPTLVHSFNGYAAVLGIVEVERDQFYVAVGNLSVFTLESVTGSWSVFHVDMAPFRTISGQVRQPAVVKKVTDFPEAGLLNGLGLFSKEKGLIYVADSGTGAIFLLDVRTGKYTTAILDPLSIKGEPIPTYPAANGVHYNGHHVYFTNVAQGLIARVPVHTNGSAAARAEVVLTGQLFDDFIVDAAGVVTVAVFGSNDVIRVQPNADFTVLAGTQNNTALQAATAVARGRTSRDNKSLYVSKNGGVGQPTVVGGGVMRIDF